ncbi:2Fe-2S iron-sulfur cluster-binding protein [Marinobacterium litorale]|uniref:2Fe-2S iron-sulfur cluster-binding protein n=1 Tax=Marinobacterium litorale TaxID=404770 RepID=UPI0004041A35|nr:2Fe-2S iron-sulfur cluster-binding protein [Marinobacterium litorale]
MTTIEQSDFNRWQVSLPEEGVVLALRQEASLLEQLVEAGVPLRHACRNGVCEICEAWLLEGRVEQAYPADVIEGNKERAPLIRLCTARALSDLTLKLTGYARRQ